MTVLSIRNNNPGNLREKGSATGFRSFQTPEEGLAALRADLKAKISGGSSAMRARYGERYVPTLQNLISTWAPPEENDTQAYINFVASRTGLKPESILEEKDLDNLIPAMIEQEGGKDAVKHFKVASSQEKTIDVELPDGTVIEGVPSGMPKAELIAKLKANGYDVSKLEQSVPSVAVETEMPPQPEAFPPAENQVQKETALTSLPEDYSSFASGTQSALKRLGSIARSAGQGLTFGALDEIQAGMSALPLSAISQFTDNPLNIPEAYDKSLGIARNELEDIREEYPWQSLGAEIFGSLPTGTTAAKTLAAFSPATSNALARLAATKPVRTAMGVGAGAAGVYGFNEGEGGVGNRAENSALSMLYSLPFSAAGGYIAGKIGSRGVVKAGGDKIDEAAAVAGVNVEDMARRAINQRTKMPYSDAVEEAMKRPQTIDTLDVRAPARVAMHEQNFSKILNEQITAKGFQKNKIAEIILGPPGAGKSSTIANELRQKLGAIEIDSDMIKELMPEYDGGLGTPAVHAESKIYAEDFLNRLTNQGFNLVHPIIGNNPAKVEKLVESLRKKGYTVNVRFVDVTPEESLKRVMNRYTETGRIVPIDKVQSVKDGPLNTFQHLKEKGLVNAYTHFDNNSFEKIVKESSDEAYQVAGDGRLLRPGLQSTGRRAENTQARRGSNRPGIDAVQLTPEQVARSETLAAAGIPVEKQTGAMVSRDPALWQFEQNTRGIVGVGDDLRNRYVQANELIKSKLDDIGVSLGGKASTAYEAGESVTEAVLKKSDEMQAQVGRLYSKIREKQGDNIGLNPKTLLDALDEASDSAYADNIVNSVFRKMKRYGISADRVDDAYLPSLERETFRAGEKADDIIVFRFGLKDETSLKGKNAGTAHGVANYMVRYDDFEAPQFVGEPIEAIHAYKINSGKYFSSKYENATHGTPAGSADIGVRPDGALSFGKKARFTEEKIWSMPIKEFRQKFKEKTSYRNFDASGSELGAKGLLDIFESRNELSVKNAEELRKFIGTFRGDKQNAHIVRSLIDSLDDDVIATAGDDAFKTARDAAKARFREFESKILSGITEGRLVSDDVLKKTAFGGKVKDLQALKDSLLSGTDNQTQRGTQAWNDLRLQTLQAIIDDSTVASGKLQGSRFAKNLDKIGKERLEILFSPEEILQLKTIRKALEYTTIEVPESVVNYSGTAAAGVNSYLGGIISKSGVGTLLERGGEAASRIPLAGPVLSPLAAIAKAGGKVMNEAALRQSVQNTLDPLKALRRLADPRLVRASGLSGAVTGANQADK